MARHDKDESSLVVNTVKFTFIIAYGKNTYLLLPMPEQPNKVPRAADELALEERDVEYRRVVVDELQQVYLEGQRVVELGLRAE